MPRYYEYEEHIRGGRSPSPPSAGGPGPSAPRDSRDSFVRETMTLEPPPSASRPRSQPPPNTREMVPRGRSPSLRDYDYESDRTVSISRSRSRGGRRGRDRSESPMSKARNAMQDNFTNSTAGIGASLIGAIAGGYAGRVASGHVSDKKKGGGRRRRSDADKDERIRLGATILGAALGGLGANALTNRFEDSKERTRGKQAAWEDRFGPDDDLPHYDSGRRSEIDHRNGRGA